MEIRFTVAQARIRIEDDIEANAPRVSYLSCGTDCSFTRITQARFTSQTKLFSSAKNAQGTLTQGTARNPIKNYGVLTIPDMPEFQRKASRPCAIRASYSIYCRMTQSCSPTVAFTIFAKFLRFIFQSRSFTAHSCAPDFRLKRRVREIPDISSSVLRA